MRVCKEMRGNEGMHMCEKEEKIEGQIISMFSLHFAEVVEGRIQGPQREGKRTRIYLLFVSVCKVNSSM